VKQDGSVLGDVVLPPWANGSPDTFVRTMRAALEHPIVSASLHRWIDLIFGLHSFCVLRGLIDDGHR
jgi:hypothetical protein